MCEAIKVLNLFCKHSGLKINYDKSHLFLLGPLSKRRPAYLYRFHFDTNAVSIKYLGITFSHHKDDFFRLNYVPRLSRIKHLLQLWSLRDLTPIGKVLLLKTFAISQLVFLFMVLPNPPDHYLNELNKLFFNFIWNSKPDKVKRSVLCNGKANGGLNMLDVYTFATSLKTRWVKMYVDDHYRPWKVLFSYAVRNHGGEFLFSCNFKKEDILTSNNFIREVCDAWAVYNFSIPEKDFGLQFVLNNSCVKINNKVVYSDVLHQTRGYKVSDFFSRDGHIIPYQNFVDAKGIRSFPFTYYYGIISAIPPSWKSNLQGANGLNLNECRLLKLISIQRATNFVYKSIIANKSSTPRAISKWEAIFPNHNFNWKNIFMMPFVAVREAKI